MSWNIAISGKISEVLDSLNLKQQIAEKELNSQSEIIYLREQILHIKHYIYQLPSNWRVYGEIRGHLNDTTASFTINLSATNEYERELSSQSTDITQEGSP